MSAPGYVLVEMKVTDPERYARYMEAARDAVLAAGGEYLVRGGRHETLEGTRHPARVALLRFPSYAQAKAWYDGERYRQARTHRDGATETFDLILVEGVDAPV
jgi:uncharacterized protein (DUF1330 family)